MLYQKKFTLLQNSVYLLSFDTSYKMYWPCMNKHWPFQMVMSKIICAEWEFKGLTGLRLFRKKGRVERHSLVFLLSLLSCFFCLDSLRGHSTESKTTERPLKDHETCLIFPWSFNELSMISEVFHDSWLIFQWSSWSPYSPKLFETVQNSLSVVFQENSLSLVFQQSFSGLSMNFQRSY